MSMERILDFRKGLSV